MLFLQKTTNYTLSIKLSYKNDCYKEQPKTTKEDLRKCF